MPNPRQSGQKNEDFQFRIQYDHFLRFRIQKARPNELKSIAKELGFNINDLELFQKKIKSKDTSFRQKLISYFGGIFRYKILFFQGYRPNDTNKSSN